MQASVGDNNHVYRSKVDGSGRIVLPVDLRLRQHIHTGDQVIIIESSDGLKVKTQEQTIREARSFFTQLAPAGVLLSEKLIDDRREEAKHE